jgi:hypothetical protein
LGRTGPMVRFSVQRAWGFVEWVLNGFGPNRTWTSAHFCLGCHFGSHDENHCVESSHGFSVFSSLFRVSLRRPFIPHIPLCPWPVDVKFLDIVAPSSSHFFCTTSNSNRLDSLVCLGWDCCCTVLPSSCAHGPVDIAVIALLFPPVLDLVGTRF